MPRNFDAPDSLSYDENANVVDGKGWAADGKSTHGTGTLALLAGKRVTTDGFDDDIGGAPDATVFEVKINAPNFISVVHLATATMAKGIDYAVNMKADVISISAGGIPSRAWSSAVNKAYAHGTVIVAAAGDFLTFPVFGFPFTPTRTVYPATFPRVLAVTGITEGQRPYALLGTSARPFLI